MRAKSYVVTKLPISFIANETEQSRNIVNEFKLIHL